MDDFSKMRVKLLSSSWSTWSSQTIMLYWCACEQIIPTLQLSGWWEWTRSIAIQSEGFLYIFVLSFLDSER